MLSKLDLKLNRESLQITKNHYDIIVGVAEKYKLDECYNSRNLEFKNCINYLKNKFNKEGQVDYIWDDLLLCIDGLRYSIASVLFYKKLGLTPIVAGYNPSNIDWLFCFFLDDGYSRLYSTWNRVGNFLNVFFEEIKNDKNIYFDKVIDKINKDCYGNNYYFKLKKFRDKEYKIIINPYRNEIIHNQTSYYAIIKNLVEKSDESEILEKQQKDRDEKPQFLAEQYQFLYNSLENIINLVKIQFPNEVNKDGV
ncbi:MAG: Cthe_2314 family HEPN domain-containing protein [Candidatus Kerfeldbacteria bacterium]